MTALVTIETVILVLLAVLVAGLLRSHAEILRRLESEPEHQRIPGPEIVPPRRAEESAEDISGVTLAGGAIKIAAAGGTDTLVAFLSSGCLTCGGFWDALSGKEAPQVPGGGRTVVVTKDSSHESPSRLRELAPETVPVIMSSEAWEAYGVPMSPYFVYLSLDGRVLGEGTASTWAQVTSLVRDALGDAGVTAARTSSSPGGTTGAGGRFERADGELRAAGIGPDDPSLYVADDPALTADGDAY